MPCAVVSREQTHYRRARRERKEDFAKILLGDLRGHGGEIGFHVYFPHRCPPSTTALSNALSAGHRTSLSKFRGQMASRATVTPNCGAWRSSSQPGWYRAGLSPARGLQFWQ